MLHSPDPPPALSRAFVQISPASLGEELNAYGIKVKVSNTDLQLAWRKVQWGEVEPEA
jgi:hypothetical protein